MKNFNILTNDVLRAFDCLYYSRHKNNKIFQEYYDDNRVHSHSIRNEYDGHGNLVESYEYCLSSVDNGHIAEAMDFSIKPITSTILTNSHMYIGVSGMISYKIHPLYLDDIEVMIKPRDGIPTENYKIRELLDEGNHFMLSTVLKTLPEREELLGFYEFSQKVRSMMMSHKSMILGTLWENIIPTRSSELLEYINERS